MPDAFWWVLALTILVLLAFRLAWWWSGRLLRVFDGEEDR